MSFAQWSDHKFCVECRACIALEGFKEASSNQMQIPQSHHPISYDLSDDDAIPDGLVNMDAIEQLESQLWHASHNLPD